MDTSDILKMRKKQLIFFNIAFLALMTILFFLLDIIEISIYDINLILGITMLTFSITRLTKKDHTKSWFPILEKVAKYEKKKMGKEWEKQYKTGNYSNLIVGGLFVLQALTLPDIKGSHHIDFAGFWAVFVLPIILLINILMYFHFRKIDRANTVEDFKGFTLKSVILGLLGGIILVVTMIVFILFYVINN
ncbi:hypothetical protein VBD025_18125 [Virgibacillus flavescens]|uniref:hypothetical protein n=1 Tax=Virgibacillus flavescens TaxID=1611422 RepID=UPI003D32CE76